MSFVLNWILKTVAGRIVTGTLATMLLSYGVWKWYDFKDDLIIEGQQACVQEINKETVEQLQTALEAEKAARRDLVARLRAAVVVNQQSEARRRELADQLEFLHGIIQEQKDSDEVYKTWSDTALPDGVASRLRSAATGSDPGTVRDDSN